MIITRCPASCGELIQGYIDDSEKLISLPINLYSTVTLFEGKRDKRFYAKSYQALKRVFEFYGYNSKECDNLSLKIDSKIPIGKGMASSTADIAATILAGAKYLGKDISTDDIALLSTKVEPSDSVFFDNLTLFDHINGDYYKRYGSLPNFKVLLLEGREVVNTIEFRKIDRKKILLSNKDDLAKSIRLFEEGMKEKNLAKIAEAATISAFANQKILYKDNLKEIHEISIQHGALGINVAHSGSVIGILYQEHKFDRERFVTRLKNDGLSMNFTSIIDYNAINGGVEEACVRQGDGSRA